MKAKHMAVKKNLSSIQVLKTLQALLEGDYTMSELIEKLNSNENEPIFNNSVISKYINTCRYCGIEIPKIHNKYFVAKLPFGIELSENEYKLLQELQNTASEILSVKKYSNLVRFFDSISKFTDRYISKIDEENYSFTKEIFDRAIKEKNKIRLMFKAKSVLDCIPMSITHHKGKVCFKIFDKTRERMITLDRLSGIQILPEKFSTINRDNTVIYKLTGELSSRYCIREHEDILENKIPEYIVIANHGESQDCLISRLLRYGSLCEILKPDSVREDMKKILSEMLSNYEV